MSFRDDIRASLQDWEEQNPQGWFDLGEVETDLAKNLWRISLSEIRAKQAFYSRQREALLEGRPHLARFYSPDRHVDRLLALYDAFLGAAVAEITRRSHRRRPKSHGHPNEQPPNRRQGSVAPELGRCKELVTPRQPANSESDESKPPVNRLGRNIEKLRKDCGWSVNVLAEKTGIDKKLVISHLKGRHRPVPRNLKIYADAFAKGLGQAISPSDLEK